jgi:hypothetical protein
LVSVLGFESAGVPKLKVGLVSAAAAPKEKLGLGLSSSLSLAGLPKEKVGLGASLSEVDAVLAPKLKVGAVEVVVAAPKEKVGLDAAGASSSSSSHEEWSKSSKLFWHTGHSFSFSFSLGSTALVAGILNSTVLAAGSAGLVSVGAAPKVKLGLAGSGALPPKKSNLGCMLAAVAAVADSEGLAEAMERLAMGGSEVVAAAALGLALAQSGTSSSSSSLTAAWPATGPRPWGTTERPERVGRESSSSSSVDPLRFLAAWARVASGAKAMGVAPGSSVLLVSAGTAVGAVNVKEGAAVDVDAVVKE